MDYTVKQIAAALDYAKLHPLATSEDIREGAVYCVKHEIKSFCVASVNVAIAASIHENVSAVVGFPHGNSSPYAKLKEGMNAIDDGATELDVVINYGRFLGGNEAIIHGELRPLCERAHEHGVLVKAILESCYYNTAELVKACKQCIGAGVDFLKTSTGFGQAPATPAVVATMLMVAEGTDVQVKASGGIKTYADAKQYLDMGCTRLGASHYLRLLP